MVTQIIEQLFSWLSQKTRSCPKSIRNRVRRAVVFTKLLATDLRTKVLFQVKLILQEDLTSLLKGTDHHSKFQISFLSTIVHVFAYLDTPSLY